MTSTISKLRNEEGFTLIELLIVIVVLGILASIVLFAIGQTQNDANSAKTTSNKKICATASSASSLTGHPVSDYLEAGGTASC
jgi:prepilin-type N-terminal cleavage/methylation domain-containing protein